MEVALIGITGYKQSGKSTISRIFRKNNIPVVDVDSMYTDMFKPGTYIHQELLSYLGCCVLAVDGCIDIKQLAILSAQEPWIKKLVDDVVDECIDDFIVRLKNAFLSKNIDIACIESNVILNTKIFDHLSDSIFICCPEEIRKRRLFLFTSYSQNIIDNIILSENEIDLSKFSRVIDNNGTLDEFSDKCINTIKDILKSIKK